MNKVLVIAAVVAGLSMTACTRSVNSGLNPTPPPQPLPSTPTQPVETGELAPPGTGDQLAQNPETTAPSAPTVPTGETEVASLDPNTPPATSVPITREGMAGSWAVPTDSSECRIILAFTQWSGGYRAATRRCNSPEIGSITAWDVKDQQVVLVDGGGNTVARLYSSGGTNYDGTTNTGKPISFRR